MNIWKKFMSLFSTTKEIDLEPIDQQVEEFEIIEDTITEQETVEVKETKPKRKRYYRKKPKTTDGNVSGERPTNKPKRQPKK